jgi:MEDS: MEthanogen/methylotroph, DcmR Sensory domain
MESITNHTLISYVGQSACMEDPNHHYSIFNDISNDLVPQLLKLPQGYHCLILYPNIETIRKIYAEYIRLMIEENDVAILFLPYYDTTDKVRQELMMKGLDVRKFEQNNSLTLIDFTKVVDNPYLGLPAAFGLKEFVNKIQDYDKNKNLVVIADMSIYNHSKNIDDILRYESLSDDGYCNQNWRQLCLYHKLDYNLMFTDEQKQKIFDYHKDKVMVT